MELLLLKYTSLGVYAIEIATAVVLGLRNLLFIPLYCAHILKSKWYTFYPTIIRGLFSSIIIFMIYYVGHKMISINSWMDLIICAGIAGFFGYVINLFLLLNKSERNIVFSKFKFLKKVKN